MRKIHQVRYVGTPNPPDGGWGWIIVVSSLFCNVIIDGIVYSFGVLLPKLVLHFDEGKGAVAWVGSIQSGVYSISGSIASILVNKYGCRVTCIMGSMVGMAALAISSLSNSLAILMISYGIMGGFGFGLVYFSDIVCVNQYFDKKRALAVGITACGAGIGSFLMTPLAAYLLDQYGWKGTNLIMAGIVLNCAIFGSLMRPLEPARIWDDTSYSIKKKFIQTSQENGSCKINLVCNKTASDHLQINGSSCLITKNSNNSAVLHDEEVDDISADLEENKESLIDFSLLKNPAFSLMCVSYVIGYLGLFIPHTYIIDFAIFKSNFGHETAAFLVSIIGISNMIARPFFGYLSDFPAIDPLIVMYICTTASSVIAFCIPLCSSYYSFTAISAVYGVFSAPLISLTSIVLTNMLGVSKMVKALGLLLFLFGFSIILGSPIAGWILDWTQTYEGPFWFSGATLFLASILLIITSHVWRYQMRLTTNQESEQHCS